MDPLGELLSSDHRRTLEFFVMNLKDVSEPTVDQQELLYNASVLAHYAQISVDGDVSMAAPADLTAVFDHFVADMNVLTDPLIMETAGAQCLLLAGFFEDQMRRRHNIHWYPSWAPASTVEPLLPSSPRRKRSCSTPSEDISSRGAAGMRG